MKIKLSFDRAGGGAVQYAGEIVDVPVDEALALIRAGQAESLDVETTMVAPTEAAVLNRPKARKGQNYVR